MDDEGEQIEYDENDIVELTDDELPIEDMEDMAVEEPFGEDTLAPEEDIPDVSACTFAQHKGSVFSVDVHSSGKLAVSGGEDNRALVWDTIQGDVAFECSGHKDSVTFCGYNSSNKYLCTADMSGTVQVWAAGDGKHIINLETADVSWMMWHSQAPVLLVGTAGGEVWMWQVPDGKCKILPGHGPDCTSGSLLPDGTRMIAGYEDGAIKIWNMKENKSISVCQGGGSVTCTAAKQDGVVGMYGCSDAIAKLFSCSSGDVIADLTTPGKAATEEKENSVESVGFSKINPLAAVAMLDGTLSIWDLPSQKLRDSYPYQSGHVKVVWSENQPVIYSGSLNGVVCQWDCRTGRIEREWTGHKDAILDLSVNEIHSILVTASDDNSCKVFPL